MAARLAYPRTAAGRLGLAIRARMTRCLLVAPGALTASAGAASARRRWVSHPPGAELRLRELACLRLSQMPQSCLGQMGMSTCARTVLLPSGSRKEFEEGVV
jgi:hypothetical protein